MEVCRGGFSTLVKGKSKFLTFIKSFFSSHCLHLSHSWSVSFLGLNLVSNAWLIVPFHHACAFVIFQAIIRIWIILMLAKLLGLLGHKFINRNSIKWDQLTSPPTINMKDEKLLHKRNSFLVYRFSEVLIVYL